MKNVLSKHKWLHTTWGGGGKGVISAISVLPEILASHIRQPIYT